MHRLTLAVEQDLVGGLHVPCMIEMFGARY
jgi:hypothetical protein